MAFQFTGGLLLVLGHGGLLHPNFYFALGHTWPTGEVTVTAGHYPPEFHGIKICLG